MAYRKAHSRRPSVPGGAAHFLQGFRHLRDENAGGGGWIACLGDGPAYHNVIRARTQRFAWGRGARLVVADDGLAASRPDAWTDHGELISEGRLKAVSFQGRGDHAIEARIGGKPCAPLHQFGCGQRDALRAEAVRRSACRAALCRAI